MLSKMNSYRYLKPAKKNTSWIIVLICAFIFIPLWLGTGYKYREYLLGRQLSQETLKLSLLGNSLGLSISKHLVLLDSLAAFVEANQTETLLNKEFETFASGLYYSIEGIRNFAVAPDGIIKYVYPHKGNENVYGHDLINDKRHNVRVDVQRTINTQKVILSGPYELRQGGMGLVARKAVYLDNSFWGLATMVIDMTPVYKEIDLFAKLSEVQLSLRAGPGENFYGENSVFQSHPLIVKVPLTDDDYWELAEIPDHGWYPSLKKDLYFFQGVSFIVICLLATLIYLLISRQKLLLLKVYQGAEENRGWWQIFKNAEWGVALVTADKLTVELMNPACAKMHGYAVDELIGKEISLIFQSDFRQELTVTMNKCHESGNYTFEEDHIRKDGTCFPAYHDITTIKDDENPGLYYIFNIQDISDRRKIEEELRQHKNHLEEIVSERTVDLLKANKALMDSENRYHSLSDAAFEGIVLTEKSSIIEINDAMVKMFGYEMTDLADMKATDLAAPDFRKDVHNKMISGDEKPYESVGLKKNGTRFPVEVHARMFHYKGRDIRVASIRDLTESKRAEQSLRKSEMQYQDLYDNAPDMFGSVDAENATILRCNNTLATVLGYTKEEIIGRPVFELYTADSAEYSKDNVFPKFTETGIIRGEELQLQRKDGSSVDVSLNVTAFRDKEGNILHSNSVWRDITEQKKAEKALHESERMQGVLEMAGAVCHELNQPIMAIAGFSELILMNMIKDDPLFEKISKIAEQSERLGKITLKLMNITKYSTKDYSEGQIIDIEKSSK